MSGAEILLVVIVFIIMVAGMFGTILPGLPGIPMIFVAALLYGLLTDFERIGSTTLIWFAALAVFSYVIEWISSSLGAKKLGGTWYGMAGAMIGMLVGLVIPGVGIVGFVATAFIGAFLFEFAVGRDAQKALRAGAGSFLGFLAGGVLKFVIAAAMIGVFAWQVLF
jgi:uncharacterized protein YqgC (DUF456 family)